MAYDLNKIYGYGDGHLDDVDVSDGLADDFGSYAKVYRIDELDSHKIYLDFENAIIGRFGNFLAGSEIMLHVSASALQTEYLGKYLFAKILLSQNGVVTLDKDFTELMPVDQLDYYHVQAILVLQFDCLKLKQGGVISPSIFDPYKFIGGVLAFKCWDSLIFDGGHISLTDCGIPANRKHLLRPLTEQETASNGESDFAKYSGQENFITSEKLLLNAGDGAAFIVAKNFVGNAESRIGNVKTHGARYCRGAENSVGVKPSRITNKGGSTIFIAAENISNFDAKMIAKYRDDATIDADIGAGLCRCYIASKTILPNDEGLYAYDAISDNQRLSRDLNVKDFGAGNYGSLTNPTKPLNNYAQVTAINQGGCRLTLANETVNGLTPIDEGTLILVQVIQKSSLHTEHAGEIVTAKVLKRGVNYIVIDFPAPNVSLTDYLVQVISIPQFMNFTLNQNYTAMPKFNGKTGGVFAIAVDNICDLTEGKINVEGKGGAAAYGRNGLEYIGNAQDSLKLPLGEGHGSVFILAKTLKLSANSRIGATYSGSGTGNRFGGNSSSGENLGGGYSGDSDSENYGATGGGYNGGGSFCTNQGLGGSGASGGTVEGLELERDKIGGGYGSNGQANGKYRGGYQGAHLMIIADKVENFDVANFSTGGEGGRGKVNGVNGAAGYGGGGAIDGSNAGSSGWCFIYNNR